MASGGKRQDILGEAGLTPGEKRTIRFVVKDSADVDIVSFTGWTFKFYLVSGLHTLDNLTNLEASATLKIAVTGATAPNVDVPLSVDNTKNLAPKKWAYELWRNDSGNERRLAYGIFQLIH